MCETKMIYLDPRAIRMQCYTSRTAQTSKHKHTIVTP